MVNRSSTQNMGSGLDGFEGGAGLVVTSVPPDFYQECAMPK